MSRSRSGISPVVATVILVAVAIVIAIAVAFWASGLVGIFTRFEKLEIVSAIMTGPDTFQVIIRNTGSADTAIIQVVAQGRAVFPMQPAYPIKIGETHQCDVTMNHVPPGVTVELSFYTSGGKTYPTAVLSTLGQYQGEWTPEITRVECSPFGRGYATQTRPTNSST